MALQLVKAKRSKAWLKMGLSAPSGGGKTAGSLLLAYGLMHKAYPTLSEPELWEKIAIVDTENGSGQLYVGSEIAGIKFHEYNAVTLTAPYTAEKYIQAIELCEKNGIEVCILDSTSHLWSGEGGLLEQQSNVAKRTNNSYTAWRDITPLHNQFVTKMLTTPMHIIATMRAKQEYAVDKDSSGKTSVKKLGLEPEQRKGMEYEFTCFFEVDAGHTAFGAKDRTSIFDQQSFKITPSVGEKIMEWLQTGVDTAPVVVATSTSTLETAHADDELSKLKASVVALAKEIGATPEVKELLKSYEPSGNPNKLMDAGKLKELETALIDMKNVPSAVAEVA